MKPCINCGNENEYLFCPNCGQKMSVQRVTFKGMVGEFISKWIGFDNQFGRTMIGMVTNPGHVIRSFLHGNRKKYIGPLSFLVIMTALLILSADIIGIDIGDLLSQNQEAINPIVSGNEVSEQQVEFQKTVNKAVAKYFRFISVALIPFFALCLSIFYKSFKYNYSERLVVTTYMVCQGLWLTILMMIILKVSGQNLMVPFMIASILYNGYVFWSTFKDKNFLVSILKSIGVFVVGYALFIVFALLIGLVVGIIIIITNPEILQQQG